jgi:hypothetical protein
VAQAKTFAEAEFNRLLAFIATQPHAARNRAMVLMAFWFFSLYLSTRN